MKFTRAFLPLACLCLSTNGHCKTKKVAPPKKVKPAAKIVGSPYNIVPPAGLYEVHERIYADAQEDYFNMTEVESEEVKWIRLYKNGTYKTSDSKKGKLEGRYSYKRKNWEIIWKAFKPTDSTLPRVGYYDFTPQNGHRFWWPGLWRGHESEVSCSWKKP